MTLEDNQVGISSYKLICKESILVLKKVQMSDTKSKLLKTKI